MLRFGYIVFLLLTLIGENACAQFRYEGKLKSVDTTHFFQIDLPPFLYNQLNKHQSDLRILDREGKEVPYVWKGVACNQENSGNYLNVSGIKFRQREEIETKRSILTISLPSALRIDSIEIFAKGPKYFKRRGRLSFLNYDGYQRKKRKRQKEQLQVELSSDDTLKLALSEAKVKELTVEIENDDNPPLIISKVLIKQRQHSLVAFLKKGERYSILFGAPEKARPNYDLEYFKSKLPEQLPVLVITDVHKKGAIANVQPFYKKSFFIWSAILSVIVFLGFVSVKMVRELGKSSSRAS